VQKTHALRENNSISILDNIKKTHICRGI